MKRVKVKRFDKRPTNWNGNGTMDYLMGQEVNVVYLDQGGDIRVEDIDNPNHFWWIRNGQYDQIEKINEPDLTVIL
jgi:hypothetical protein